MKCPNRQFDIHQVGSIESCSVCNHYNGTERTVADLTAELERAQESNRDLQARVDEAVREFSWYEEQRGLEKYVVSVEWLDDLLAILQSGEES